MGNPDPNKPDLRTINGVLDFLDYHPPTEETKPKYEAVNFNFKQMIQQIWDCLPDGPGKTVAVRAIGRARMECNSCIANGGQ